MKISEKEALIRKLEQLDALERKRQYSTISNNSVWKTVGLVFFGILGLGCFAGIVYLVGQNSVKNNRCKC